jgi:glutathione-independent formaldehyde dehydrogenase
MTGNKAVAYKGPGKVELIDIDYPSFELKDGPGVNPANVGRSVRHGVILKTVATNICGSDQHMVRGRTTAPADLVLGHEITGEVVEVGPDVEFIKVGDICSVPFNIACGRCRNCKERKTGICLNVNPARPGAAYGYVDMGGWVGGQANYVLVPYADWNLLKFPDRDQALEKMMDLTMLSDIFPTGFHGAPRSSRPSLGRTPNSGAPSPCPRRSTASASFAPRTRTRTAASTSRCGCTSV